jgi:hypothetical protein
VYYLFIAVKAFPYFSIPSIIVLADLTFYFRRKKSNRWKLTMGIGAFLGILTLMWMIFRGDLNSESWTKNFLWMIQ